MVSKGTKIQALTISTIRIRIGHLSYIIIRIRRLFPFFEEFYYRLRAPHYVNGPATAQR
jgi:hypothetical protein